MSLYKVCPHCGSHLDSGESCDCVSSRYAQLTPANRERFDAMIGELLREQNAVPSSAKAGDGKQTTQDT